MFGMAVRSDVIRSNPVAAVKSPRRRVSRASSALPLEDVPSFLHALHTDPEIPRLEIADLFEFMLFTGCRIGEALALRWSHVNLEGYQVTFAATVVRISGGGLHLQEQTKTDSSTRTIGLPPELTDLLLRRHDKRDWDLVFPSMLGKLRDTDNTEADWRANRDRLGFPAVTSQSLRKTAARALDVGGASARAIAEYLGHKKPSMTQDVCMSRTVGSDATAAQLHRMFGVSSGSDPDPATSSPEIRGKSGPRGARTHDPGIKSPLLYRLS
jgi:integrase